MCNRADGKIMDMQINRSYQPPVGSRSKVLEYFRFDIDNDGSMVVFLLYLMEDLQILQITSSGFFIHVLLVHLKCHHNVEYLVIDPSNSTLTSSLVSCITKAYIAYDNS